MVREISKQPQYSVRRTSKVLGQRRESLYYKHKRVNEDAQIEAELQRLSKLKVNWGFGLMYGKLKLEGRLWGKNRVYRHYKALKLNLRATVKRRKIKRANLNTIAAQSVNEGWSIDFLSDNVVDENKTRILNVISDRRCGRIQS